MTSNVIADSTWIKEKVLNQVARLGLEWKQFSDFYSAETIRVLQKEIPSLTEFLGLAQECIVDRIALRLTNLVDPKGDLSLWKLVKQPEFCASPQEDFLRQQFEQLAAEINNSGSLKFYRDKLIAHKDRQYFLGTKTGTRIDPPHFSDWVRRTVSWMDTVDRILGGTGGLQDLINRDSVGEVAGDAVRNYGELLQLRYKGTIKMDEFGKECWRILT